MPLFGELELETTEARLPLMPHLDTEAWELPKADYETVAGLALATLHRIPRIGEEFDIPGYHFTVLESDERRVVTVKIMPLGPRGAPPGPERATDHIT